MSSSPFHVIYFHEIKNEKVILACVGPPPPHPLVFDVCVRGSNGLKVFEVFYLGFASTLQGNKALEQTVALGASEKGHLGTSQWEGWNYRCLGWRNITFEGFLEKMIDDKF